MRKDTESHKGNKFFQTSQCFFLRQGIFFEMMENTPVPLTVPAAPLCLGSTNLAAEPSLEALITGTDETCGGAAAETQFLSCTLPSKEYLLLSKI